MIIHAGGIADINRETNDRDNKETSRRDSDGDGGCRQSARCEILTGRSRSSVEIARDRRSILHFGPAQRVAALTIIKYGESGKRHGAQHPGLARKLYTAPLNGASLFSFTDSPA